MSAIRQAFAITTINLRSIPQRIGTSLVICVGIAGVVAVFTTVLAMANGLKSTLANAARVDRAIVLRSGSLAEALSTVSREDLIAIETASGIARTSAGKPAVSAEVLLSVNVPRKSDGQPSALSVRGLTPIAADVRPEIALTEGRMFATGVHEIIVGKSAYEQFADLDIGDRAKFHGGDWKVVGRFASNGDVHESEVLTDATTLMSAAQRTVFSAVTVTLNSPAALDAFKEALLHDPTLKVDVQRETDYYAAQSKQVAALLEVGAATGGAIAWLLFNGSTFSTGGALGQVALRLQVGAPLIAGGMLWAVTIGLIGGLFPAIRAARMSVSDGLRVV